MDIQVTQILFQILNFGVVLGALSYLLYRPILKILNERAQKIEDGQVAAQKALTEAQNVEAMKKAAQQQAEQEAAQILEQATKKAQARRDEIVATAKEEAQAEAKKITEAARADQKRQLKSLEQAFQDAVLATSTKVLGKKLDAKAHSALIDEEFAALLKQM